MCFLWTRRNNSANPHMTACDFAYEIRCSGHLDYFLSGGCERNRSDRVLHTEDMATLLHAVTELLLEEDSCEERIESGAGVIF